MLYLIITVYDCAIETVNESVHINYYDKIYLTRRQMDACKELGKKEIEQIILRKQNYINTRQTFFDRVRNVSP